MSSLFRLLLLLLMPFLFAFIGTESYSPFALEKRPLGDLPPYRFVSFFRRSRRFQQTSAGGHDELWPDFFLLEPFILEEQ
ncbi:hypothetical protein niasHT_004566 [Heterodera trifolii]|uniref:Uncharacterized protein n=1 Tax=Heterodera trifolii TaxID=157864 RepID=A0ABD2M7E3_9BILA